MKCFPKVYIISLALIICHVNDFIFTMEAVTLQHQFADGGHSWMVCYRENQYWGQFDGVSFGFNATKNMLSNDK